MNNTKNILLLALLTLMASSAYSMKKELSNPTLQVIDTEIVVASDLKWVDKNTISTTSLDGQINHINIKNSTKELFGSEEPLNISKSCDFKYVTTSCGRLKATISGEGLDIIDMKMKASLTQIKLFEKGTGFVQTAQWSPCRRFLMVSYTVVSLKNFSQKTKTALFETKNWTSIELIDNKITAIEWHPTQNIIALALSKKGISLLSAYNLESFLIIQGHDSTGVITDIKWSPDGKTLAALSTNEELILCHFPLFNNKNKFLENFKTQKLTDVVIKFN